VYSIRLEKILFWTVRLGAYILPFTLLVVSDSLFFPFITGKNLMFRIIVEIMLAGWIGLLIINFKKYWPRWNFVSIALTVFVGIIFLSSILGTDFKHSFWSNFERMEGLITHLHVLFLFFILAGTFRTRKEWAILFGISIFVSILIAFLGLLEYSGMTVSVVNSSRIISTLGNPLYVAAYLSLHIFLTAFLWFQVKSKFLKWLLAGVFLFNLTVFFLTGARGAFVGMLAGVGSVFLLLLFTMKGLKKRLILGSLIILLLLVPVLLHISRDTSFVKNNEALSRFSNITLQAGEARFTIWGMAIDSFKERPILGWGVGNFGIPYAKHYNPEMFGQEAWFDRTHNMPLEWLVSGGIIGFSAYIALFASIIWALIYGVKHNILQKKSAFIFVGMLIAYLIQLLFVFDTLSSYLMLAIILGFFSTVSSTSLESWLSQKNTMSLFPTTRSKNSSINNKLSRKQRKAEEKRLDKLNTYMTISIPRISGIVGIFVVVIVLIIMVNIRPMRANATLLQALRTPPGDEAKQYYEKALSLSKGTIGTPEIREHLALNTYRLTSQPELLQQPEISSFYQFATEEMEKQVQGNSDQNLKIKHNISLAQLYGMLAVFGNNNEALQFALYQYDKITQFAPNYVHTYPVLANTLAQAGRVNEAIPFIEKAEALLIEADRYDDNIFYSKPLFYTAAGRYNNAYEALKILSELNQGLNSSMMERIILAARPHGSGAIPFLERVYLLDRRLSSVSLMLAQLHAATGNIEQAQFYANEALKEDPSIKTQVEEFLGALIEATSSASSTEE